MRRLLIQNIRALVSCDGADHVYEGANLYCEDGRIRSIGPQAPEADEVIDGSGLLCYPGLVNAHHHLYQLFSRNLPQVQNLELFDWLTALYEIWKGLNEDTVRLSSMAGMGELLKNGCTTVFDHHYVFPAKAGDLIGAQAAAAETLGVRMHFSRGSMDRSKRDGGLPPDSVVQTVDEILRDSVDLIGKYHDPSFGSMRRLALAPCSPFSVSAELLRQSALLAREYGVRLHTHLCETMDEERYTLETVGLRPLAYMETLGWEGPDVWYAHGIHFNDSELQTLAETGTGICHCPVSNMKLSSGVARVPDMLALGVPVGLGGGRFGLQRRLQSVGGASGCLFAPPADRQRKGAVRLRPFESGHHGRGASAGTGDGNRVAGGWQVRRLLPGGRRAAGAGRGVLRPKGGARLGGAQGTGGLYRRGRTGDRPKGPSDRGGRRGARRRGQPGGQTVSGYLKY